MTRYPLAPLLDAVAPAILRGERARETVAVSPRWPSQIEFAAALGCSDSSLVRYRRSGMDAWTADRLACHAGFHPATVWLDWFEVAA